MCWYNVSNVTPNKSLLEQTRFSRVHIVVFIYFMTTKSALYTLPSTIPKIKLRLKITISY